MYFSVALSTKPTPPPWVLVEGQLPGLTKGAIPPSHPPAASLPPGSPTPRAPCPMPHVPARGRLRPRHNPQPPRLPLNLPTFHTSALPLTWRPPTRTRPAPHAPCQLPSPRSNPQPPRSPTTEALHQPLPSPPLLRPQVGRAQDARRPPATAADSPAPRRGSESELSFTANPSTRGFGRSSSTNQVRDLKMTDSCLLHKMRVSLSFTSAHNPDWISAASTVTSFSRIPPPAPCLCPRPRAPSPFPLSLRK